MNTTPETDGLEHDRTGGVNTKKVLAYGWDVSNTTKRRITTDADGHLQVDVLTGGGAGTALSNGQVSVDSTADLILAASAGRQGVLVTNQGSVACYVGTSSVSTSNGFLLNAGESVAIPTDSAVYGVTASSSTTIGYLALA